MRIFRQKRWLLLPGLLVLGAALLLYARFVEPARLTVRTRTVQAEGLSRSLKVVFFTDTHFGRWYDVDRAARLVDAINARQPDVVLFGGDLLDNCARDRDSLDLEELAAQLGRIQAPGGKFAVWGNHDYGGGAVRVYESLLEQAGFQVLNDESRLLEEWNVQVVGYDDVLMGWTDPELYQLHRDIFQLVVAHEPSVAEKISAPGECFVLSGHTHGGQASLPLLNRLWLPAGSGGMVRGGYTTQDGTQVYVSSGVGLTKLPLRFLCPPEIVCVTFEPAV